MMILVSVEYETEAEGQSGFVLSWQENSTLYIVADSLSDAIEVFEKKFPKSKISNLTVLRNVIVSRKE